MNNIQAITQSQEERPMVICRKGPKAAVHSCRPRWALWDGKKARHPQGTTVFIATRKDLLNQREMIRKDAWLVNRNTDCPIPMPENHIMFLDCRNNFYKAVA